MGISIRRPLLIVPVNVCEGLNWGGSYGNGKERRCQRLLNSPPPIIKRDTLFIALFVIGKN